jgi:IclR family acetate operon transcriptional repressor
MVCQSASCVKDRGDEMEDPSGVAIDALTLIPDVNYLDDDSSENSEFKSTLSRVFRILSAFSPKHPVMTLAELCRATGLPKTTVHRLLHDLVFWGALERTSNGYGIGTMLFEIGSLHHGGRLREMVLPFMEDLFQITRETIHLAIRRDLEVVYLEKIAGQHQVQSPSRLGGRMPAYCTGVGKVLLAFGPTSVVDKVIEAGLIRRTRGTLTDPAAFRRELKCIAQNGYAIDREESRDGVVCAAAPLFSTHGRAIAAMSVTGSADRLDPERIAQTLQAAAFAASRTIRKNPALDNYGS